MYKIKTLLLPQRIISLDYTMKLAKFLAAVILTLILFQSLRQAPTLKAQIAGNYLELLGGYLKASNTDSLPPAAFTFEAWIKPASTAGRQIILSIGSKSPQDAGGYGKLHYEIALNGGSLDLSYRTSPETYIGVISGNIKAGEWSHIGVTVTSARPNLFVNGQKIGNTNITSGQLLSAGPDIILGDSFMESYQFASPFKGSVDEVRISKAERDVAGLWTSGAYNSSLVADGNTVLLWHMDQVRGETTVADSSSNGISGSLIGGDGKIHFYGVLPTATPFVLPTIRWLRPILPTLSFPFPTLIAPTNQPAPTGEVPTPTSFSVRQWPRPNRTFSR